jgi:uncharacterized repeat protein (TIGR01451 family)
VKPTAEAGDVGSVANTATAQGSNTNLATGADTTDVDPSGVTIGKSDDPRTVQVGDFLIYTLTVTNNTGDDDQDLVVVDELPDEVDFRAVDNDDCEETPPNSNVVECTFMDLADGDSETVDILVEVEEEGDGTITNTAQVFDTTDLDTPIAQTTETTNVDGNDDDDDNDDNDDNDDFDDFDDFDDEDDESDLEDAENDLEDGEVTIDSEFDSDSDGDGVSATSDGDGAEASTPGASASSGGDPDEQAPVSGPLGDVEDEIPTSGPLPNTGGMSILAVILPVAGFLVLLVSIIHRIKGNR